jgi:hypothetical protein
MPMPLQPESETKIPTALIRFSVDANETNKGVERSQCQEGAYLYAVLGNDLCVCFPRLDPIAFGSVLLDKRPRQHRVDLRSLA